VYWGYHERQGALNALYDDPITRAGALGAPGLPQLAFDPNLTLGLAVCNRDSDRAHQTLGPGCDAPPLAVPDEDSDLGQFDGGRADDRGDPPDRGKPEESGEDRDDEQHAPYDRDEASPQGRPTAAAAGP
jgi:hypothetical protein